VTTIGSDTSRGSEPPAAHAPPTAGPPHVGEPIAASARAALAILALIAALWAVASLSWPFGWDQGVFAWIGDAILHGRQPYLNAWDVKGPAAFYPFALTQALFGRGMSGIRVFDLALLALAAWSMLRHLPPLVGRTAAAFMTLFLILQYASVGYWDTAQPDGWQMLLTVAAVVPLLADPRPTPRLLLLNGAVVGLGVLFKPPYLALGLVPLLAVLLSQALSRAERRRGVALLLVGAAAPVALCLGWLALHGALGVMFDGYIEYNLEVSGVHSPVVSLLRRMYKFLVTDQTLLLALPAAFAGVAALTHEERRRAAILGAWIGVGLLIVLVQGRLFVYHWHAVFAPLLLLAGTGLARLWPPRTATNAPRAGALRVDALRAFVHGYLFLLALFVVRSPLRAVVAWGRYAVGASSQAEYDARFGMPSTDFAIGDDRVAAAWLAAHTAPETPVLVWSDPMVSYLAGRPTVSRFPYHIAHVGFETLPPTPRQLRYRAEFFQALARRPPALVLVRTSFLSPATTPDDRRSIPTNFPEFGRWLDARYRPDGAVAGFTVYRPR
jgi:Dolichyl-phosphate-mannose-protein mannosyltransferase